MSNKILIDFLPSKDYINENFKDCLGRIRTSVFKFKIDESYNWCMTDLEYLYCIENDINEKPMCQNCGLEKAQFKSYAKGYKKYCSLHCTLTSKEISDRKKETCLKTYGTEYSLQSELVKAKGKETTLKKYGVEYAINNKEIRAKQQETILKKYGTKHPFQSKQVKDKIKSTILDRYGVNNVSKNENIKSKKEKTFLQRFGETCNLKSKVCRDKMKETNLKIYGVEIGTQQNITNYENYNKEFIEGTFIVDGVFDIDRCFKYFNLSISAGYKALKRLNIQFDKTKKGKNKTQEYLFNHLKELSSHNNKYIYNFKYNTYDIIKDNDKKLELDIYIEMYENNNGIVGKLIKKIAIEYNGLMFHSFGMSHHNIFNNFEIENELKYRHLRKTELCEEQSIQLFHIFENEWLDPIKRRIWLSMLSNTLMLNNTRIMARKCSIRDISNPIYNQIIKEFLETNHIQGFCPSNIKIGLYFNNELVSLMTFGKSRYNKEMDYELIRFCSKTNINVIGGSSKLLNYFKLNFMKNNEKLISYGNRRWSSNLNNVYKINNFTELSPSQINYFYFHKKNILKLYNRTHFQKHKIKEYFDNNQYLITDFDSSKSERINMYVNGYRKIYEVGQLVYVLTH